MTNHNLYKIHVAVCFYWPVFNENFMYVSVSVCMYVCVYLVILNILINIKIRIDMLIKLLLINVSFKFLTLISFPYLKVKQLN